MPGISRPMPLVLAATTSSSGGMSIGLSSSTTPSHQHFFAAPPPSRRQTPVPLQPYFLSLAQEIMATQVAGHVRGGWVFNEETREDSCGPERLGSLERARSDAVAASLRTRDCLGIFLQLSVCHVFDKLPKSFHSAISKHEGHERRPMVVLHYDKQHQSQVRAIHKQEAGKQHAEVERDAPARTSASPWCRRLLLAVRRGHQSTGLGHSSPTP